jgi:hypothetical protein
VNIPTSGVEEYIRRNEFIVLEVRTIMYNKKTATLRVAVTSVIIAATFLSFALGVPAAAPPSGVNPGRIFENTPPIAEKLDYGTFKSVPLTGRFSAQDPDGDNVTFEITSYPKKGAVSPDGAGAFVYTPRDNARGKDSFEYVAIDSEGTVSAPATVKITIRKRTTKTTYSDMEGSRAQYAALVLADTGVFVGERIGNECFFRPEREVTRGEFLAMSMTLCGGKTIDGVTRTGFYDDAEIPAWAKPYISAGLVSGVVNGYRNEDGRFVFSSDNPITFSEAAVLLDKLLDVTAVQVQTDFADGAAPAWAAAAAANLSACGVLPPDVGARAGEPVTRADAAEILTAASELMQARQS